METKIEEQEWVHVFIQKLKEHILAFLDAAGMLGVERSVALLHDLSKHSDDELYAYASKFVGGVDNKDEWEAALLHHYNTNKHHWQYWLLFDNDVLKPVKMPEEHIREMVADWMASNKVYKGSFDMTDWLRYNLCKVVLHKDSAAILEKILIEELGYDSRSIMEWM